METTARVYVGTYNKYNNGSLNGAWINVFDYTSQEEFLAACEALHSDELDPELMFQDFQGFPRAFYSESEIDDRLWDLYFEFDSDMDRLELFAKWCDQTGNSLDTDLELFESSYYGEYESDEDFAAYMYDDVYDIPDHLYVYIDWSKVAYDLMFDYIKIDGHYFTNN